MSALGIQTIEHDGGSEGHPWRSYVIRVPRHNPMALLNRDSGTKERAEIAAWMAEHMPSRLTEAPLYDQGERGAPLWQVNCVDFAEATMFWMRWG